MKKKYMKVHLLLMVLIPPGRVMRAMEACTVCVEFRVQHVVWRIPRLRGDAIQHKSKPRCLGLLWGCSIDANEFQGEQEMIWRPLCSLSSGEKRGEGKTQALTRFLW